LLYRGGLDHREGHPRSPDAGFRPPLSRLRFRRSQRLLHPRAYEAGRAAWAVADSSPVFFAGRARVTNETLHLENFSYFLSVREEILLDSIYGDLFHSSHRSKCGVGLKGGAGFLWLWNATSW